MLKTIVSKSCNDAITRLRKTFENLRNFWTNEHKTGTNFMHLSQFDKVSHIFLKLLMNVSVYNFIQSISSAQTNWL